MIWHNTDADLVLKELNVDKDKGLYSGVADESLEIYGKNTIKTENKTKFIKHFLSSLNNKFNYILIILAVLSVITCLVYNDSSIFSPIFIVAILIINSLVSAYYKHKSIEALNSLSRYVNPLVNVLRDGVLKQIPSEFLVPGDILVLKEGDYITADARLIETNNFRTNEVSVTGEKFESEKQSGDVLESITPINKRTNMIFAGSSVSSGTAKAVVVETGRNTELGKSAEILEQTGSEKLPINDSLEKTEKIINAIVIVICAFVFILEVLNNLHTSLPFASMTVKMLSNAAALCIAAIPESLPAISVIVVALGINRIIENRIMVKKIKVFELLGKTNVICADKTGILTKRVMHLENIFDGENTITLSNDTVNDKNSAVLRLAAICSTLDNDSTEDAIKSACEKYCNQTKEEIENVYPRLAVIPFDTVRKTMTTINMINGSPLAIVKGAPETLLPKCVGIETDIIEKKYKEMSENGQRVLMIAVKPLSETPANPSAEEIENELTFAALLGLSDPPRTGAVDGIKICTEAGIKTIMITGDSLSTAISVARQIGVLTDDSEAITGEQLNELSDEELYSNIKKYSVYARITPQDKLRIISAWQHKGKIVTVTGDNTEDADALNLADVGCVMGKGGTDVARGTADLVIEENNFKYLVKAIKESRGLFENIKKSICYLLGCNLSELLIFIICLLAFGFPPLAAVQLLLINLITDCAPSISLATEPADSSVMKKKPTTLNGKIFDFNSIISIISNGIFMTITAFVSYTIGIKSGSITAVTMAFLTISLSQILHSFNLKSESSILKTKIFANKFMNYSTIIAVFVCMFLCLTPAGAVLELTVLSAGKFFISLGLSLLVIPFGELQKFLIKKYSI